jgi:hypothetical protein
MSIFYPIYMLVLIVNSFLSNLPTNIFDYVNRITTLTPTYLDINVSVLIVSSVLLWNLHHSSKLEAKYGIQYSTVFQCVLTTIKFIAISFIVLLCIEVFYDIQNKISEESDIIISLTAFMGIYLVSSLIEKYRYRNNHEIFNETVNKKLLNGILGSSNTSNL